MASVLIPHGSPPSGNSPPAPKAGKGVGAAIRDIAGTVERISGAVDHAAVLSDGVRQVVGSSGGKCDLICQMTRLGVAGTAAVAFAKAAVPLWAQVKAVKQDEADRKQERFEKGMDGLAGRVRPALKTRPAALPSAAPSAESAVCAEDECLTGEHVVIKGRPYFQLRDGRAIRCQTDSEGARVCRYKGKDYKEDRG